MADWRITAHWAVTGYSATDHSKECYHYIVEGDGNVVKGTHDVEDNDNCADGNYAAHVRNCNTRNIGVALACMDGAQENPRVWGKYPITWAQFDAMTTLIAKLCRMYNVPVEPSRVLTHAEIEPTLGIEQAGKWDITVLPWNDTLVGHKAVGDYLRAEVAAKLSDADGTFVPPTAVVAQTRPLLYLNCRHPDDVRYLQRRLQQLGLYAADVDARFGLKTQAAVKAFQIQHNLEVDGKVGRATWTALESA